MFRIQNFLITSQNKAIIWKKDGLIGYWFTFSGGKFIHVRTRTFDQSNRPWCVQIRLADPDLSQKQHTASGHANRLSLPLNIVFMAEKQCLPNKANQEKTKQNKTKTKTPYPKTSLFRNINILVCPHFMASGCEHGSVNSNLSSSL